MFGLVRRSELNRVAQERDNYFDRIRELTMDLDRARSENEALRHMLLVARNALTVCETGRTHEELEEDWARVDGLKARIDSLLGSRHR